MTLTLAKPDAFAPVSDAVPLTVMLVDCVVELFAGDEIASVGAVVSGAVRVMIICVLASAPKASTTFAVIVLLPTARATFEIVHVFVAEL